MVKQYLSISQVTVSEFYVIFKPYGHALQAHAFNNCCNFELDMSRIVAAVCSLINSYNFYLKNLTHPMCIARVDSISRHFQGPRKYGIYQYLQRIHFHRLITGQNRLVFHKNNIWDHPACFMHVCIYRFKFFSHVVCLIIFLIMRRRNVHGSAKKSE